jgi:hypothetical protein
VYRGRWQARRRKNQRSKLLRRTENDVPYSAQRMDEFRQRKAEVQVATLGARLAVTPKGEDNAATATTHGDYLAGNRSMVDVYSKVNLSDDRMYLPSKRRSRYRRGHQRGGLPGRRRRRRRCRVSRTFTD